MGLTYLSLRYHANLLNYNMCSNIKGMSDAAKSLSARLGAPLVISTRSRALRARANCLPLTRRDLPIHSCCRRGVHKHKWKIDHKETRPTLHTSTDESTICSTVFKTTRSRSSTSWQLSSILTLRSVAFSLGGLLSCGLLSVAFCLIPPCRHVTVPVCRCVGHFLLEHILPDISASGQFPSQRRTVPPVVKVTIWKLALISTPDLNRSTATDFVHALLAVVVVEVSTSYVQGICLEGNMSGEYVRGGMGNVQISCRLPSTAHLREEGRPHIVSATQLVSGQPSLAHL